MALLPSLGPPGRPRGQDDIDPRLQAIVEDLERRRNAEMGASVLNADPERVARANALARRNGVPAPIVEGDLAGFEARDRSERFVGLVREHPALGQWASDRRNASAAADDTDSLGALGSIWRQVKNTGSSLKSGFYSSSAGLYEVFGGLAGGLADEVAASYERPDSVANRVGIAGIERIISAPLAGALRGVERGGRSAAQRLRGEAMRAKPQARNVIERGIYGGFESIPTTIGGMVVGALTRNPSAAAGVMGGTVVGNEYREALDKGLSPQRAARYALGQGAVEYLTEKIPASRLLGDIAGKTPIGKTFMRQLTAELPGEQVATIVQDMNEWATLNPDKPFMDYVRERPQAALQTALATVSGVGGVVATAKAVEKTAAAGVKVADRVARAASARREGQALDQLAEAAEKSKLKQRDPQAFSELMRAMGGDAGVNHVFVDAEAARAFMQADTYDGSLDPWADDIADAVEAGGDFAIAIGDVLTDLAGKPAWEALRPDMRLSPGGMSPREAEAFDPAEVMETLSDAAPATADDPKVRLFDSITRKLTDAGFTPTTARVQAELLASRYATRAERGGEQLTGREFEAVEVVELENVPATPSPALEQSLREFFQGPERQIASRGATLAGDNSNSPYMVIKRPNEQATASTDAGQAQEADAAGSQGEPAVSGDPATARAGIAPGAEGEQLEFFPGADFGVDPRLFGSEIEVDGVPRPTENADGKPIAQTRRGVENFWRWFGDSKAVDNEGRPLVFYHGSRSQQFDMFGSGTGAETFFFAIDRRTAEAFQSSDGALIEAYLRVENIDGYDAEDRMWDAVIEGEFESWQIDEARDRYVRDNLAAWAPSGEVEEVSISEGGEERDVFRVSHPLEAEGAEFETEEEAQEYLTELQDRERDEEEERLRDVEYWELEEEEYLTREGIDMSTDAVAAQAASYGMDAVWIDNVDEGAGPTTVVIVLGEPRAIKATTNTGAFDPDDPRFMYQSFADGPRGRIVFPEGQFANRARIELFKARNLSTFLHEAGHLFLEELRFDAEMMPQTDGNESARQTFADWEAVKAWFKANGHAIGEGGTIPVEAHELWARGFERYLMEGKAPSQSLRRAFETFKSWLVNIYRSVTRLDAPITDEIREVMGRLIATDAEIADAAEQQEIELIFSSAVEAGMGESAFRALQEAARNAKADAGDELLKRVMAPIRARVTQEYKDREVPIRAEVTESVDRRPVFRAMRLLKDTPMATEWLLDRMGEDAAATLPPQVPPVHKRGGASPADIAEQAGFNSPEEMIDALRGLETERQNLRANGDKRSPRQAIIDGETDEIMRSRYGDPFTDGSIEEEALALIHNDAHGEVMAAELRALGRQTGKRATTYRLARNWARETVRTGSVNETTSRAAIQRYQRSAAKAGKAAMDAMIAGDREEAFRHKQSQMIHNALVAEAKAALDEVEAAVARLEKLAKRRTLKSTDQDYLEQAQALLEAVDMRARSQASLNRQGSFEAWAREQEANGIDVVVPGSFEASLGTTHWSRLTVEQLLGLDAATRQIMHLGRLKQTLLDAKEEREFDEIVAEATEGMAGMSQKPPSDLMEPGWWDSIKSRVAAWDVALLKAEQVFDWLDQSKVDGVFNRIVFQPIAKAQAREAEMMADYSAKIRDTFAKVGRKTLSRWAEPFSDARLINRESGNPYQMKREQLIAMALNMGNEGNIQRLADGYGWNEASIREVLNAELTAEEWAFVQDVWDTIDGLWPEIAAMERRVNGIAPEKVEAVPVETPHGVFRGGYYPAIYDASKDYNAERQAEKASDLFETRYTRATTRASATKERADAVKRPILLQLAVVNRHIGEVIHDITHREPIMQAHKFLNDRRIKKAIDDTLGPEYRKMFQPWIKHIANQWAHERAGADAIGGFMQKLRGNTTVVGMGWRITTMLQQVAGYSNAFEMVGARWVTDAIGRTAVRPVETFNFVMERSGEVRHRMDTLDRDIRLTLREMSGRGSKITAAKRFAFHGIGYMDRMVTIPAWLGAYNKALAGGSSEEVAIQAADKAIRLSQGAAGAKDLAAVATGQGRYGELMKLMTMFYSYLSAVYGRQRTLARDMKAAGVRDVPGLIARAWWLVVAPPLLAEILSGRGPEEDEDWGLWAFSAMFAHSVGAVPILRDAARPLLAEITGGFAFDYAISPVQRGVQTAINTGKDFINVAQGEETSRATRNALETVGYFTGLVPGQVAQATQFLVDVSAGEQRPRDFGDWWEGITTGKVKDG